MSRFSPSASGAASAAAQVPEGYRQAASMLHSMPEADRRDLLQELDPTVRGTLVGLLGELAALRMPRDPSWLEPLQSGHADPCDASVSRLTAERVFEVLVEEPDALVARVLALAPWPWKADVMARFDAGRRSALERGLAARQRHVAAPAGRRAIELHLMAELLQRCGGAGVDGPMQLAKGASRWRRRIAALLPGGGSGRVGPAR